MWVYDRKQVSGFVIAAGAILGCLAAIFWSAQVIKNKKIIIIIFTNY